MRPLQPVRDVADLYPPTHGDPALETTWAYMGYGPFQDSQTMQDWLTDAGRSTDPLFFAVIENRSSAAIGMVSILNADLGNRRLELGHIWYVPAVRRTTATTETAYLLLREAFEHYHCRRVEWKCDSLNEASRAAAVRLGFTYEGIFRNHMIVKGHNRDTAWYAMTDEDWPEIQTQLFDWLYRRPRDDGGWPGSLRVSPPE